MFGGGRARGNSSLAQACRLSISICFEIRVYLTHTAENQSVLVRVCSFLSCGVFWWWWRICLEEHTVATAAAAV